MSWATRLRGLRRESMAIMAGVPSILAAALGVGVLTAASMGDPAGHSGAPRFEALGTVEAKATAARAGTVVALRFGSCLATRTVPQDVFDALRPGGPVVVSFARRGDSVWIEDARPKPRDGGAGYASPPRGTCRIR